jgi:oligopeptide/dipeptide ABC transporter ATP-binding protein
MNHHYPLLRLKNVKKYFPIKGGVFGKTINFVKSVDGVSLDIDRGRTLALVGESGCGKTTLGRTILRLTNPTAGDIYFDAPPQAMEEMDRLNQGVREGSAREEDVRRFRELDDRYNLSSVTGKEQMRLRRRMQIVFQDPLSSLDPRMTIKQILSEPFRIHQRVSRDELETTVIGLLESVGLKHEHLYRYPHEFSGGQLQRICILRAIALNPDFLVLDEPTSALDVSVQAQILNLLKDLQKEHELTYLFITHDLSVVRFISTKAAVMYLGKIVETAPTEELFNNALHPCARLLLDAVPVADPGLRREKQLMEGDVPTPIDPPSGCRFRTRCTFAEDICSTSEPLLEEAGTDHLVACHLYRRIRESAHQTPLPRPGR